MVSAGRVMLIPKGEYNALTTYNVLDMVSYNGSSYVAKTTTTGNLPTDTSKWMIMASSGAGQTFENLSDVDFSNLAEGDLPIFDSNNNEWKNTSTTTATVTNNPISITTQSAQVARDTKITLSPIQASGTPTPANPLPISGYDNVSLDVVQKNLFNKDDTSKILDVFIANDGSLASSTVTKTVFIPCAPNTQYTVSKTAGERFRVAWAKEKPASGAEIYGVESDYTASAITITTGADARYLVAWVFNGDADVITAEQMLASVQIELGSTATTYEPYNPATLITHSFPTTIYGGEVDVERGVLKVTHKGVDMGDLNWSYNADARLTCGGFFGANITDGIDSDLGRLCSTYPLASVQGLGNVIAQYGANVDKMMFVTTGVPCYIIDSDYTSGSAFKTAVTGQKLVYELATPYEIPLTPRLVNLLQGANVITSNGTSVTLTYREGTIATLADIPSETVNKLAELKADKTEVDAKANLDTLGPIENGATASQAYAVGDYFVKDGNFCRCISAISIGSTFTLNTNYAITKVGTQLASTNTDVAKRLNVTQSVAYLRGDSNWDNVKTPGLYFVNLYDGSGGQGAFPVQAMGQLLVMNDDIQISQIFFSGNAFGYRAYTSGAWGTWKTVSLS